jgi:hypothetical protein
MFTCTCTCMYSAVTNTVYVFHKMDGYKHE